MEIDFFYHGLHLVHVDKHFDLFLTYFYYFRKKAALIGAAFIV